MTDTLEVPAYAGPSAEAVRRRRVGHHWTAAGQQDGGSTTSTVAQFIYPDRVIRLHDTPVHRDASDDSHIYLELDAADAARTVPGVGTGVDGQARRPSEPHPVRCLVALFTGPHRRGLLRADQPDGRVEPIVAGRVTS